MIRHNKFLQLPIKKHPKLKGATTFKLIIPNVEVDPVVLIFGNIVHIQPKSMFKRIAKPLLCSEVIYGETAFDHFLGPKRVACRVDRVQTKHHDI